ncbi:hypothetical protein OXX80_004616 [Metschnikowia pulcherrima]
MAVQVMSQKSTRLIFAGLLLVVVLNISFFFYEKSRSGEFEVSLEKLVSAVPGTGSSVGEDSSASVKIKKAVYRPYYDDRNNGLLVVSRSEGAVWDEKDAQTSKIREMFARQEKEEFTIFEIAPYEGESIESSDAKTDAEKEDLSETKKNDKNPIVAYADFQTTFISFFDEIMKHLDECKPSVRGINTDEHYRKALEEDKFPHTKNGKMPTYGGHLREQYKNEPVRTYEYLKYFFRLSDDEVRSLKSAHEKYLQNMKTAAPENLLKYGAKHGYMQGNGIIYLGGGKYNQLVLTSISVLRSLGSVMPVEVLIPKKKDFDIDLCNTILPKLNAKCKVIEDFVPASVMSKIGGFQLKNVALLVSSFQNVLYLDADNIPIKNPDILFVNEPFKSSRMVMWPDLWRRSTSPLYYDIAGITVDKAYQVRNSYFPGDGRGKSSDPFLISYHDLKGAIPEASSETGQMMIDKEKHFSTLILSMYYNFYGPDYYYPLFSQGAAGEGDKETFIAAAHKLELPYYQVGEFNREFGPMGKNNKREYFGMGQYDPIVDYVQSTAENRHSTPSKEYATDQSDSSKDNYDFHFYKSHSLMFLHANWPKFYVAEMFDRNSFGRGPKDAENNRRRLYSDYMLKETGDFDIELHIMRHIESWACDTRIFLTEVPEPDTEGRKKICTEVAAQIDFLIGG